MNQLNKFHQTKPGLLIFALMELALAYGFVSLAIDRGNFIWYLLSLIFVIGFVQNLVKLIGRLIRGRQPS